ncbi:MAG TPA: tripartite tricarboxylate transporter substrate binding protein, partial [Burkholderiales bacterium]|nr:tripartite tricarboxylate transporter substrate binding protein [Burkholderiales bacterium]
TRTIVLVNAQLPAKSMTDLVELSKTSRVHFGSSGHGNSQHLLGELVNARSGAKLVHVPYKGFALIITGVISNEVQVAFGAPTTVMQHIKAGRIRAIAYTGAQRWPGMPELPTAVESGIPGLVYAASWHGLFAPVGTPPAVISTVHAAFAKAVHSPQMAHMLSSGGHVAVGNTPAEFKAFLQGYFKDTAEQMRIAKVNPE